MPNKVFNLSDVRKNLPSLVEQVARTKQAVIITRHGTPVAQLTPYVEAACESAAYPLRQVAIEVADDFDAPLPAEHWEALR